MMRPIDSARGFKAVRLGDRQMRIYRSGIRQNSLAPQEFWRFPLLRQVRTHLPLALALLLFVFLYSSSTSRAGDLHFKRHVISDETDYSAAALMDVNHDGKIDIVCGGEWYEGPAWKKHFLAEIPRIGGRPDGFAHLPFDINRDGWVDLITVNYRSRSLKWMEHPGALLGPWTTHVTVEPGPMETGRLVDIDRDGNLDLLPNGANFAAWWEFRWKTKTGVSEPAWIRHNLPDAAKGHGLGFGDVNGDGRGDIVGQNGWLEAPDDARNGRWRWHADFQLERASIPMLVVDVDDDGDSDIVWCSAHGFGVYWLEQTSSENDQRQWIRHAIDTSWSQGHSPLWHDMDGDGRAELITGKRYMAHGGMDPGEYDPIAIYRYQFNPETQTWDRWTVSGFGQRVGIGLDPKIADIDGDGDADLLASGRSGLYWLENLKSNDIANFESDSDTVEPRKYDDHQQLLIVKSNSGATAKIEEPEAWGVRRSHIIDAIEKAHSAIPSSSARVPLNVRIRKETSDDTITSQEIDYQATVDQLAVAELRHPKSAEPGSRAGLVCMFEPSDTELAARITSELTSNGFVCIVPQLIESHGPDSLTDTVWQTMRAADVLQASGLVHAEKIGFVGNALQGQLGLYVAALDQRFIATVTDISKSTEFIALTQSHYSLAELIACVAPRSLQVAPPESPELVLVLQDAIDASLLVFKLRRVASNLVISETRLRSTDNNRAASWKMLKEKLQPQFQLRRGTK